MHHIRLFSKPGHKLGIQAQNEASRLPPELMILIASFVREVNDLANLCIVSKALSRFCTPMLYQAITLPGTQGKAAVQLRLYHTLQSPRFSNLITELRVVVGEDTVCDRHHHKGIIPSFRKRCTCDAYDRILGQAILGLRSLVSLTILCTLPRRHEHGYLFRPEVPMLRRFALRCYNSGRFTNDFPAESILLAPFMSSVTELALECHAALMYPHPSFTCQTLIKRPEFAPHLHTFQHGGGPFPNSVLATRPIERLCLDTFTHHTHAAYSGLTSAIWMSAGTLSHLLAVDLLQWLPRALKETVKPYHNLRFIGTITGSYCEEEAAFREMGILASLGRIEAMEVNQYRAEQEFRIPLMLNPGVLFDPSRHFFELLEERHPLLRRVLLIARQEIDLGPGSGPMPVLWEKADDWSSRTVPYLEYWDILCDKLDKI